MDSTKEEELDMSVSIILPVYNVEQYLERCIRSLLDQDLPNREYEIIVVNDGSPDNSREVVLRLMKEFENIVFIEQENKGVSLARNAGIDRARGRYLLFIDPDDYVLPKTLNNILKDARANESQVTFLGYKFLDVDGNVTNEILNEHLAEGLYSGVDAYLLFRGNGKTDPDRSVAILYERQFMNLNQLRYISQIPYLEDGEFIARVLCLADRCLFNAASFYIRTTRPGSATNSNLFFQEKSIDGFIRATSNLLNFRRNQSLNLAQLKFMNQPICKFALLVLLPSCSLRRIASFRRGVVCLKEIGLRKIDTNGCNKYYRLEASLYNLSPFIFYLHRIARAPLLKLI